MNQEYKEIQIEIKELIKKLEKNGFTKKEISKKINTTQSLLSMSKNKDVIKTEVIKEIKDKLFYLVDLDIKPEKTETEILKSISEDNLVYQHKIFDLQLERLDRKGELTLEFTDISNPVNVGKYLFAIENAYNKLYVFDKFITKKNLALQEYFDISTINIVPSIEHQLKISKVVFNSPGFWKFIGDLNVLTQIREFIKENHERRKDKNYRNEHESSRLELENKRLFVDIELQEEKLKQIKEMNQLELIKTKIELLEKAGYDKKEIRELTNAYYIKPLMGLNDELKINQFTEKQ